jgi:D-alanyl-D-alanine carboxypeptidase
MAKTPHNDLISQIHRELDIPLDYAETTGLIFFAEVSLSSLNVCQLDIAGRPLVLAKHVSKAWLKIYQAALKDGVELLPFSGFRSYRYQQELFLNKIRSGIPVAEILRTLAAPGYSEHHTGEAIDITTVGCPAGEEEFDTTIAHRWLVENGARFGFAESFKRGNPHNIVYEPWHWRFLG